MAGEMLTVAAAADVHISSGQWLLAGDALYVGGLMLWLVFVGAASRNRHAGHVAARLPLMRRRAQRLAGEAADRVETSLRRIGVTDADLPDHYYVYTAVLRRINARSGVGLLWTPAMAVAVVAGILLRSLSQNYAGPVVFVIYIASCMMFLDILVDVRSNPRDHMVELAVNAVEYLALPDSYRGQTVDFETAGDKVERSVWRLCQAIDRAAGAGTPLTGRRGRRRAAMLADRAVAQLQYSADELIEERTQDRLRLATLLSSVLRRQATHGANIIGSRHRLAPELIDDAEVAAYQAQKGPRDGLGWVWVGYILVLATSAVAGRIVATFGFSAGVQVATSTVFGTLGIFTLGRLGIPKLDFIRLPWAAKDSAPDDDSPQ